MTYSSLNLTPFTFNADRMNGVKYKSFEIDQIPQAGVNVFIWTGAARIEDLNSTDKANVQIVKKAFGYAKLDKFHNMSTMQINAMNKNLENGFVANKTIELHKMYNELAMMFLYNLHRSVWNTFDVAGTKYVESTIDYEEVYEDLNLAVESFRLILTKIIND